MQPPARQISVCPNCGGVVEETSGTGGGCMFCLLQAGIGSEQEVAQDSTPAVERGARFGVYEIDCHADGSLCELGRGAMGVTYRATDTALQRKVALKIIKSDIAQRSADARERFMREARAAAALRHENIATVHQFGMRLETGQYFYAMELIEGETLEERVRRTGPLDSRTTIGIAQQVTSALAAAEKHGLVHRDLKPANLMLVVPDAGIGAATGKNKKPLVKIIDFGLAKAIHAQTDAKSLTHDGFVGTRHSPARSNLNIPPWTCAPTSTHSAKRFGLRSQEKRHLPAIARRRFTAHNNQTHIPSNNSEQRTSRFVCGRCLNRCSHSNQPRGPGPGELAERLQRCSPEGRSVRRSRFALAAATIVVGMSALFVFRTSRIQNAALNPAREKSIAVLPFENLSEDPNNAYFADGIQDDVLTNVANIGELKVISRTSVMQYRGQTRNIREIGKALVVSNILEGSVRRSGNKVRVNVPLIDANTDNHIWANDYDRDVTDVFAIQSDLARKIAHALQAKLSPTEKARIARKPTENGGLIWRSSRLTISLALVRTQQNQSRANNFISVPSIWIQTSRSRLRAIRYWKAGCGIPMRARMKIGTKRAV